MGGGLLIISMVNHISARKQAEEEGKQPEEHYRSLFQNAVFGVFRSTPAGYFTDANPALCSMLGYDSVEEELLQRGSLSTFSEASVQSRTAFVSPWTDTESVRNSM